MWTIIFLLFSSFFLLFLNHSEEIASLDVIKSIISCFLPSNLIFLRHLKRKKEAPLSFFSRLRLSLLFEIYLLSQKINKNNSSSSFFHSEMNNKNFPFFHGRDGKREEEGEERGSQEKREAIGLEERNDGGGEGARRVVKGLCRGIGKGGRWGKREESLWGEGERVEEMVSRVASFSSD